MITFTSVLGAILVGILGLCFLGLVVCSYQLAFGIKYGCMRFTNIWLSKVPDKKFDAWVNEMFSDPDVEQDCFSIQGGSHYAWVSNRYFGFSFDDYHSEDFSYFQKKRFFKRLSKANIPISRVIVRGAPKHFDKIYKKLAEDMTKIKKKKS